MPTAYQPNPSSILTYDVYKLQNELSFQDTSTIGKRYHTGIFVETTSADGSGTIHHVTGDLVKGMTYETRIEKAPENLEVFHAKTFLGKVLVNDYPAKLDAILQSLEPPCQQKWFNTLTMTYEQRKPDGTFYGLDEARPSLFKCTEWTEQRAIPALLQAGLLIRA